MDSELNNNKRLLSMINFASDGHIVYLSRGSYTSAALTVSATHNNSYAVAVHSCNILKQAPFNINLHVVDNWPLSSEFKIRIE